MMKQVPVDLIAIIFFAAGICAYVCTMSAASLRCWRLVKDFDLQQLAVTVSAT